MPRTPFPFLHQGQLEVLLAIRGRRVTNDQMAGELHRPRTGVASRMSELHRVGLVERTEAVTPWVYWLTPAGVERAGREAAATAAAA